MEFPELPEKGIKEAEALIEAFKVRVKKAAAQTIGELYGNVMPYIETDSWTNYREACRLALHHYYVKEETVKECK
jgi:hypothetical protein